MDRHAALQLAWKWHLKTNRSHPWLRNYLARHYFDLLHHHAQSVAARLPRSVELAELLSLGSFGLLDAIERFDPARSKFETFAATRIRGAILDGLRDMDTASRTSRKNTHALDAAAETLRQRLGRTPTPEELARHLRLTPTRYAQLDAERRALRPSPSLSGDRTPPDSPTPAALVTPDTLRDPHAPDPARAALRQRTRELVQQGLSRSERLVILLYYYEGLSLKEIGHTLGLSESRVSQMRKSILKRLRSRLTPQDLSTT